MRSARWTAAPCRCARSWSSRKGRSRGRRPAFQVVEDAEGLLARRYDARPGTFYLLRPDGHVCARWRRLEPELVRTALARAAGNA